MIELVDLLKLMVRLDASDVFITAEAPVSVKVNGVIHGVNQNILNHNDTREFAHSIMNEEQRRGFEQSKEANFAIHPPKIGRFRVNVYVQRGNVGLVMRKINIKIPNFEELGLPAILSKICMQKRGLVIMVGGTGTGKSTTQAAMIGYRNSCSHEHIITIEDPIEFLHPHKKSIISQREVGIDTESFSIALKNAMRQAPDVIQIGEIRDADTMHDAIIFAETGHLCVATLHANNTYQALDRILNFCGEARREQLLMDLSMNLHALVSQRLLPTADGQGRIAAVEIMLNTPLISDIIRRGELHKIMDVIERSRELGLRTFDQSLFELYCDKKITAEEALRNAESENNLRLKIKLESPKSKQQEEEGFDTDLLAF